MGTVRYRKCVSGLVYRKALECNYAGAKMWFNTILWVHTITESRFLIRSMHRYISMVLAIVQRMPTTNTCWTMRAQSTNVMQQLQTVDEWLTPIVDSEVWKPSCRLLHCAGGNSSVWQTTHWTVFFCDTHTLWAPFPPLCTHFTYAHNICYSTRTDPNMHFSHTHTHMIVQSTATNTFRYLVYVVFCWVVTLNVYIILYAMSRGALSFL